MSNLTIRQRLLFIGLFSNADDEGRLRGKTSAVRSMVFKYDDFSIQEIEDDILAIEAMKSIVRYKVDGNLYIQIRNWQKFQRVDKPRASLLPAPPIFNSENNSKNNSENDSGVNPTPKERKGKRKERKGKEEEDFLHECAHAREGNQPPPPQIILSRSFEKEFGRPLTPIEFEKIEAWQQDHPDEIILEALKRAVLLGKFNFKYIDSILLEWEKNNLRTLREVLEYCQKYKEKAKPPLGKKKDYSKCYEQPGGD